MASIDIKRGDTFIVNATYTDANNVPIDLTNVIINSQIRHFDKSLLTDLEIIKQDQITNTGKYVVKTPVGYELPVGAHVWDIQYTQNGIVQSTETISINVIKDVTVT